MVRLILIFMLLPVALLAQKAQPLLNQADSLIRAAKYALANQIATKALNIAIEDDNIPQQALAYRFLAHTTQEKADYLASIKLCSACIHLATFAKDTVSLLRCTLIKARNYIFLALYKKASQELFPALRLAESYGDPDLIALTLGNIGNVYRLEGNMKLALENHFRARQLARKIHTKAITYNNIGVVHYYQKAYPRAMRYYDSAYTGFLHAGDIHGQALMLNNFGLLLIGMGRYDSARAFLSRSLELNESQIQDRRLSCFTLQGLAKAQQAKGNYKAAKQFAIKAIKTATAAQLRRELLLAYELASLLDSTAGNWQSAYQWEKLHALLQDSIRRDNFHEMMHEFEIQLERERQQSSLKALQTAVQLEKKEREMAEERAELERERRYLTLATGVGLVLAITVLLLLWHTYDVRSKNIRLQMQKEFIAHANAELALRNQEINQQKEEISAQAEHLNQLNDLKDRLFYIMSHELKGPLSSLGGVINLFEAGMVSTEETIMLMKNLRKDFSVLNEAFTNIFLWSNSMNPTTPVNKTPVPLVPLFGELSAQFASKAQNKSISLRIAIPPDAVVHADRYQIFVLFKNLIDNAIKFTLKGGHVVFSAQQRSGHWEIAIEDDGVGIRKEDLPKLFDLHTHFKTYGTLDEKGAGLGLLLCKEFAHRNDGKIWVESTEGKGSRFVVALPVYEGE